MSVESSRNTGDAVNSNVQGRGDASGGVTGPTGQPSAPFSTEPAAEAKPEVKPDAKTEVARTKAIKDKKDKDDFMEKWRKAFDIDLAITQPQKREEKRKQRKKQDESQ